MNSLRASSNDYGVFLLVVLKGWSGSDETSSERFHSPPPPTPDYRGCKRSDVSDGYFMFQPENYILAGGERIQCWPIMYRLCFPTGSSLRCMNPEIPKDFLLRLIAIGESHDFFSLSGVFEQYPTHSVGHYMRQPPDWWYAIADSLTENELEALVRAMTVAERDYPAFGGGSVTGTIWAFRRLQQRTRNSLDGLADWMLAHTTNPWVPFGSNNHGARLLTDLRTLRERAASMRSEKALKENERQAADAVRIADKATRDIFAAIRRKDIKAVQALVHRGARLDIADPTGNTALTYARSLGYLPVIELIEAQATQIPPNV